MKREYANNIITGSHPNMPELASIRTRILFANSQIVPGALCVNCAWYWQGSDRVITEAHTHECDEVIAFIGTDPENPHSLCGQVEMWLGGEKYVLEESCLVIAPKGVVHCPQIVRRVDRPIFHFIAMVKDGVTFI